jgi:hypothetical protein
MSKAKQSRLKYPDYEARTAKPKDNVSSLLSDEDKEAHFSIMETIDIKLDALEFALAPIVNEYRRLRLERERIRTGFIEGATVRARSHTTWAHCSYEIERVQYCPGPHFTDGKVEYALRLTHEPQPNTALKHAWAIADEMTLMYGELAK